MTPAPGPADDDMTAEEILDTPGFEQRQKADLLSRLAYDAAEQAVALEEGMPGDDDGVQRRVLLALGQLHRQMDLDHSSPTKQHGSCLLVRKPQGGG